MQFLKTKIILMSETLTKELIFSEKIINGTEIEFDDIKTIILITK